MTMNIGLHNSHSKIIMLVLEEVGRHGSRFDMDTKYAELGHQCTFN